MIDSLDFIMAYEAGELSTQEVIDGFQQLIDSGLVWKLQGSYQRAAIDLIRAGICHGE
jgi:hypothetical protein